MSKGDRFLRQAIDSVLAQTLQPSQIIVVNDGSTDETEKVLEKYGDRIQYVYQENQGVASARNCGLKLATGEYIAFLDQDDFWIPTKLEEQVNCFQENSHVGIVHSGWQRVSADCKPIIDVNPWHHAPVLNVHEWLLFMPVLLSAMLFRSCWVDRVGLFDTQYVQACDVDWIQRLALLGCSSMWLRKVTTYYRQHGRNESSKTQLQAQESWLVRDTFFSQPNLPHHIREKESEYRYHTLIWIAWRLSLSGNLNDMRHYLCIALEYSPYPSTQTVLNILRGFKVMSQENGYSSDVSTLISSSEWKHFVKIAMG